MTVGVQTEVLHTHTPSLFEAAVRRVAEALRAGKVAALPTETVYGLAANAMDSEAVSEIFRIKGRPAHNPVIVHVASVEMARTCTASWPEAAGKLAAAFWPGPLTLVLPRSKQIPDVVTAGGATVGVRWPSHPFIQAVIRACGFPLAAPSANPSNCVSPTRANHVLRDLRGKVPLIVDGGSSHVGIESTVLDLTASPPRVLRPGMIHGPALRAVIGNVGGGIAEAAGGEPLHSPGLLRKHYAPKAKLTVLSWANETDLRAQLSQLNTRPSALISQSPECCVIAYDHIPSPAGFARVGVLPHDPEAFARAIYDELHRCDETGARLIAVEAPPLAPEWEAIADRLRKAASD